jgi:NAD(P)-dependent dehydrogenase (short-subunit alcohol dehydrogenase family)
MGEPVAVIAGIGGAGQTGECIAFAFAERGWRTVMIGRAEKDVEERAAWLRERGGETEPFAADLTRPEELSRIMQALTDMKRDRLRALVCVAGGYAHTGSIPDSDPEGFHRLVSINLTTAFMATRAFLPALREHGGSIVYFTSDAALPGGKSGGNSAYAAAKGGVLSLMRAVAAEERDRGVRANALAPTQIRTAANLETMGDDARYVEREQVAETVFWLCSDDASAVSGQVIRLA